ncbi:hypothetical protein FACS1894162_0710 [Bacteroidia bacterium]|nr:hypothetical protein FACS1894162_0710 [Bacteroidia bacterium]
MATAKKIALTNAKAELASNIQSVVKAVTENYTNQIAKDSKLQLDFDKHQFQKVFDEEMKKFENQ